MELWTCFVVRRFVILSLTWYRMSVHSLKSGDNKIMEVTMKMYIGLFKINSFMKYNFDERKHVPESH